MMSNEITILVFVLIAVVLAAVVFVALRLGNRDRGIYDKKWRIYNHVDTPQNAV